MSIRSGWSGGGQRTDSDAQVQPGYKVAWESTLVTVRVARGSSTTLIVRGRTKVAIPATTTRMTPSLQEFITPSPASLPALAPNSVITIDLQATVPKDASLGVTSGTLHLRAGSATLSKPLPVNLVVVETPPDTTISAVGLTLRYPTSWHLNRNLIDQGVVALDDFGGQYAEGGVPPPEGAEVTISSGAAPKISIPDLIARDLGGTTIESTVADSVGGVPATRVTYSYSLDPAPQRRDIMLFVVHGSLLYRFSFSVLAGAAGESTARQAFETLLSTVQFTQ
ncbi:MAG: hypothetical protein HY092_03725 [Candidatus Kerfeldbacteria bacterium]|nr:hypothetical protein [Candidatus Kerfeldbacteria bacterium]